VKKGINREMRLVKLKKEIASMGTHERKQSKREMEFERKNEIKETFENKEKENPSVHCILLNLTQDDIHCVVSI
jgi:hypothetical protein